VREHRSLVVDQGTPEGGGHRLSRAEPKPIADGVELNAARLEDEEQRLDGHG
jgi:hypothetical protein